MNVKIPGAIQAKAKGPRLSPTLRFVNLGSQTPKLKKVMQKNK